MVNEKDIEQLLTAFYNGDTTQEEEALLKEYFNGTNIPENRHTDRDLFLALYDSSHIRVPQGFSERLEHRIGSYIKETGATPGNKPAQAKTRRLFAGIGSIAAALLFLAGIFFFQEGEKTSGESDAITDTFTDPREAALVAERTLTLVSLNLNKGLSSLEKVKESMDKTNELLNEKLHFNINK
ncbi:MAG: hypothetical protein LBH77_04625 [Tannerella sp.]|jgi:hypothetical protein|nr:hypothetical protein [Tannerella sp.]